MNIGIPSQMFGSIIFPKAFYSRYLDKIVPIFQSNQRRRFDFSRGYFWMGEAEGLQRAWSSVMWPWCVKGRKCYRAADVTASVASVALVVEYGESI